MTFRTCRKGNDLPFYLIPADSSGEQEGGDQRCFNKTHVDIYLEGLYSAKDQGVRLETGNEGITSQRNPVMKGSPDTINLPDM